MSKHIYLARIAIVGAGPAGLFLCKELIESGRTGLDITIFESGKQLGSGFPYSERGASPEHVTNVSANEIPDLVTPVKDWIQTVSPEKLEAYNIDPSRFNEYKVLPRLLFGDYLNSQFGELLSIAKKERIKTTVLIDTIVVDIYKSADQKLIIKTYGGEENIYDVVAVCIGHKWPIKYEGKIPGYFDSRYPPAKLAIPINHAVAIKGASLTAIDAVSTLARNNGHFYRDRNGKLNFSVNKSEPDFSVHLHSLDGLLPAIRFHLENSHLLPDHILTDEEINEYINANNGFLSLDYIFRINFLEPLKKRNPATYEHIKNMRLEEFVETVMMQREKRDSFELFKAEYEEAERSINKEESIPWKELLATLSFAVNYPAKHFSAEDMLRLTRVLKPLISIVIAFVPQGCAEELIALHDTGRLKLIAVDKDSEVIPGQDGGVTYKYADESGNIHLVKYKTFIDCTGQPPLPFEAFPFKGLIKVGSVSPARLKFQSAEEGEKEISNDNKDVVFTDGEYFLKVPGITIGDNFEAVDIDGKPSYNLYVMAVSYISGYNPDYSGLDFCREASRRVADRILSSYK